MRTKDEQILQEWIPSGDIVTRFFNYENMIAFAKHYEQEKQVKNCSIPDDQIDGGLHEQARRRKECSCSKDDKIAEREFYYDQKNRFSGTKIFCKCGNSWFIPDKA